MKQGSLVPDQIMEDMIITEMKKMQKDAWLLDGNSLLMVFFFAINSVHCSCSRIADHSSRIIAYIQ